MFPIAEHAEPFEFFALNRNIFFRILLAQTANLRLAQRQFLRSADILFDLQLDRQTVAVPAGNIRRGVAGHRFVFDDYVLENLVERMADVDVAVGVRRPVVQNKLRLSLIGLKNLEISSVALPLFDLLGLILRQIGRASETRSSVNSACLCNP